MVYLPKEQGRIVDLQPIGDCQLLNRGELEYAFMIIAKQYMNKPNAYYTDVLGALENVKQEFWRTEVLPINKQNRHDHG